MEAHSGGSAFVEPATPIGSSYQNQAIALISIYLIFFRDVPQFAYERVVLRMQRACDLVLYSAADSQEVTHEVNALFKKATQVLCQYLERWHCRCRLRGRAIPQKGPHAGRPQCGYCALPVGPLPPLLLQDEWSPKMTIKFILLRSPLANLHDPETDIVFQTLSAKPSISEILWNFSRYKGRERITLEQNPHFYSNDCLSADESAYTPMFKCYPLEDLSILTLCHRDTVCVLVDQPRRHVFLKSEGIKRRFGNLWLLNGALIFKDSAGVLEGEQSISSSLRYCERRGEFFNTVSPTQLNNILLPVKTSSSADLRVWSPLQGGTVLGRTESSCKSLYACDSRDTRWLSGSSKELDPLPPTSERPGYPVLYTSIETLNDDIILSVFDYYRLHDAENWNIRLQWCKLSHVCRRWRHLIYDSVFYLKLHLVCANGSPVVDMLSHLPPMPLDIDYRHINTTVGTPDFPGMFYALQLRDRVRSVDLHLSPSTLNKLLVLMNEPFPILEQLTISSTSQGTSLILPETFLAPNLRRLTLSGITLPGELTLLSTISLVSLTLTNIRGAGYFLPKHLVTHLRPFSQLEELTVGFSIPLPRPSSESELLDALESPVTLPGLRRFTFKGVTAYLDSLVAQIRAPLLEQLSITLFNQMAFALPQLSDFTNATPGLKLPISKVTFKHDEVSVVMKHRTQQVGDMHPGFSLRVICKQFDWQIDSAAQICRSLMPALSCVEELTLNHDKKEMPIEWQNGAVDDATWYELLRPFVGVDKLCVCHALEWELSNALQSGDVGLDPELLPALQVIHRLEAEDKESAFAPFVDTRRIAGRPVHLLPSPVRAQTSQPQYRNVYMSPAFPCPHGPFPSAQPFPHSISSPSYIGVVPLTLTDGRRNLLSTQPSQVAKLEDNLPPPSSRNARSVRGSVKIQSPPQKHIRCRIRPSHKGAGSAWR